MDYLKSVPLAVDLVNGGFLSWNCARIVHCSLMEYVESNQTADHLVNPSATPEKENPWMEKKGCTIL